MDLISSACTLSLGSPVRRNGKNSERTKKVLLVQSFQISRPSALTPLGRETKSLCGLFLIIVKRAGPSDFSDREAYVLTVKCGSSVAI